MTMMIIMMTMNRENVQSNDYTSVLDYYNDLLSAADLTNIFNTTKNTIYKEIRNGKFGEPVKIGRKYVIPKIIVYERFFKA